MRKSPVLFVMAIALASTGMSCNQQPPVAPPVQSLTPAETVKPGAVVDTDDRPEVPSPPPAKPLPAGTEDTGVFNVRLKTSKGDVVIEVHPAWAPLGAARFRELVEAGFYDDCALFRVVEGFVVQFGINGDPAVHAQWKDKTLVDDPVVQSNQRGYVVFANAGANSRSTQVFINYADNSRLEQMYEGFSPFGVVVEGLENAFAFNKEYAEAPSQQQGRITFEGNDYLKQAFPNLDYILKATIEETSPSADPLPAEPQEGDPEPAAPESSE